MDQDAMIKRFVIKKLGCNCPAEVFTTIKMEKEVHIDENIILNYKINIGNRLLIYIINIEDVVFLNDKLFKVIRTGIDERNENKLNRFRLVIISSNITEIGYFAQNYINKLNIDDPKVHFHFMPKTDIVL